MKKILFVLLFAFSLNSVNGYELLYSPAQDKVNSVNWELVPGQYTHNVPVYIETNSIVRKGDYLYYICHYKKDHNTPDILFYIRLNTKYNTYVTLAYREFNKNDIIDRDYDKYIHFYNDDKQQENEYIEPISSRKYVLEKYCDEFCTPYTYTDADVKLHNEYRNKNTDLKKLAPYVNELSKIVKSNWNPIKETEPYRVQVLLKVAKDGSFISYVPHKIYPPKRIDAAISAIKKTKSYKPFPTEVSVIDILITLDYNVYGKIQKPIINDLRMRDIISK